MNQLEDEISLTIPNFRPYTLHPNLFFSSVNYQ